MHKQITVTLCSDFDWSSNFPVIFFLWRLENATASDLSIFTITSRMHLSATNYLPAPSFCSTFRYQT